MDTDNNKGVVLLVDDDRFVLDATSMLLGLHGYRVLSCEDSGEAAGVLRTEGVDIVLTDIKMPRISGMELLETVHAIAPRIPVLLMSGNASRDTAIEAIKKGAFDMIIKPYRPEYLLLKIEKAIEHGRLQKMKKMYQETLKETVGRVTDGLVSANRETKGASLEMIGRLAGAAEFRDTDTGRHISRIGLYAGRVARVMGMGSGFAEDITFAAPMHDIGKLGIADHILLKAGPLSGAEFETIKTHTMIGHKLLDGSSQKSIRMAATIALTHHERWDGSGYPYGLKEGEIPIEGMITRICDQYDALRSSRPYKEPLGHDESVRIITDGNGRSSPAHFHPLVMDAFKKLAPDLDAIFTANQDSAEGPPASALAQTS